MEINVAAQARHTHTQRETQTQAHTHTRPLSPLMGTDKRQAPSLTNRAETLGQLRRNHFHVLLHLEIQVHD